MPLPSPDDDYTAFKNIGSGLTDKSWGLLPLEGSASGFAYQHELFARGVPYITRVMRDDWIVEVWEAEAPTAEAATVLFRQRVNFGLNIVASEVVPGVLDVFIAYPAENEQIETTIIGGQEIDPKDAVKYLDLGYKSEFGITSEFTASPGVGGGEVTGTWRSLPYVMEIPEGAVLKVRHDGWRPAGQLQASTYAFSYKPGEAGADDAAQDKYLGKTFYFYKGKGGLLVASTRRTAPIALQSSDTIVNALAPKSLASFRVGGALWCVLGRAASIGLCICHDDGENWGPEMPLATFSQLLACCTSPDGSTLYAIAKATATEVDTEKPESELVNQGDIIRIVARYSGGEGATAPGFSVVHRERVRGAVLPAKGLTRLFEHDGRFFLVGRGDGANKDTILLWESHDEIKTWKELSA